MKNYLLSILLLIISSCGTSPKEGSFLYMLDSETGESQIIHESINFTTSGIIYQDKVIFGSDESLVCRYRKADIILWETKLGGILSYNPKIIDGLIYCFTDDDNLLSCFNPKDGKLVWKFETLCKENYSFGQGPDYFGVSSGYIFCPYNDRTTIALDLKSGNILWKNEDLPCLISETLVIDSLVIIPTLEKLICTNILGGKILWEKDLKCSPASTPVENKDHFVMSTFDKRVVRIETLTGKIIDQVTNDKHIISTPAVTKSSIIFGSNDGYLYSFNKDLNSLNWKFKTSHFIMCKPIVTDKNVYFGSKNGILYSLNKETGKLNWEFQTLGPLDFTTNLLESHGPFYLGSTNGFVVDFDGREENLFETYSVKP